MMKEGVRKGRPLGGPSLTSARAGASGRKGVNHRVGRAALHSIGSAGNRFTQPRPSLEDSSSGPGRVTAPIQDKFLGTPNQFQRAKFLP